MTLKPTAGTNVTKRPMSASVLLDETLTQIKKMNQEALRILAKGDS